MPGRDYVFYPENDDKDTLEEIIKYCGRGNHIQHELDTLKDQVKWLSQYLLKRDSGEKYND